ncbi:MAG: RND transporter, partial [Dyella sp.]|nr:RND transporter [Dyella sp.]
MTSRVPIRHGLVTRSLLACAVALAVTSCSIPAKLGHPAIRDDVPLAGIEAGHRAGWPDAEWWHQYNDPQLDALIALAMKDSPDLEQARS